MYTIKYRYFSDDVKLKAQHYVKLFNKGFNVTDIPLYVKVLKCRKFWGMQK